MADPISGVAARLCTWPLAYIPGETKWSGTRDAREAPTMGGERMATWGYPVRENRQMPRHDFDPTSDDRCTFFRWTFWLSPRTRTVVCSHPCLAVEGGLGRLRLSRTRMPSTGLVHLPSSVCGCGLCCANQRLARPAHDSVQFFLTFLLWHLFSLWQLFSLNFGKLQF